jgi:hypothetical protein
MLLASTIIAAKEVLVAVFGHPPGARQVGFPGAARPLGFPGRIDVEHDGRHLGPVRALCVGIEET